MFNTEDLTMNLTNVTTKNHAQLCNDLIVRRAKTLRQDIQTLLFFGLTHYRDHGDATYLTNVMKSVAYVKTVPTKTIQHYIMLHAPNLIWSKGKQGKVFKKKEKGLENTIIMPDVPWWEHEVNQSNNDKPGWDLDKYELIVLKNLQKHGVCVEEFVKGITTKANEVA